MDFFRCSVCGEESESVEAPHRELAFCRGCGSNSRFRGLILAALRYVFKNDELALKDQTSRPEISAIGMSDAPHYARLLEDKLNYRNTYLHTEPYLDLCDQASISNYRDIDLIVCSDVIEHTKDTPIIILRNMISMLRPGGLVILSAPTYRMPSTIEWYSGAKRLQIVKNGDKHHVLWTTIRDVHYIDTNPSFHGGPGDVLEMRLISHKALLADAEAVGFKASTLEFDRQKGYEWQIVQEVSGLDAPMDGRILVLERVSG